VKRSVALLIAVAFGVSLAGPAIAQTTTPAPATPPPAATPAPGQKPAEMKKSDVKKAKTAVGTVKSASADNLMVAGKEKGKDAEWTFAVDSKTAIRKSGKSITAADLKPGDQVQVRYMDHEGKATAMAVQVKPGAASAKAPAQPAEKK
jgi:ribosomal protein S1